MASVELEASKRLCKNIRMLLLGRNKLNPKGVVFYFLSGEVKINLEMFRFFMENRVITKFYTTLVVAINRGRLVIQNAEFSEQSLKPHGLTRALS